MAPGQHLGLFVAARLSGLVDSHVGGVLDTGSAACKSEVLMLELQPITLAEANDFVRQHHRHHGIVVGAKFSIGLNDGEKIVGVAIVGRPVARMLDNGYTAEVTRLCTDGSPHAASKLYAACWRAARAMGYRRLITYILKEELGTSLKAANWSVIGECGGGTWNRKDRPRIDKHPIGTKTLWEIT